MNYAIAEKSIPSNSIIYSSNTHIYMYIDTTIVRTKEEAQKVIEILK